MSENSINNIIPLNQYRKTLNEPGINELDITDYTNARIGINYLKNLTEIINSDKLPPSLFPELKAGLASVKNAIDKKHPTKSNQPVL